MEISVQSDYLASFTSLYQTALTKDNVCITSWVLVDIRFVNDKEDIFALANGHARNTGHLFQAKF